MRKFISFVFALAVLFLVNATCAWAAIDWRIPGKWLSKQIQSNDDAYFSVWNIGTDGRFENKSLNDGKKQTGGHLESQGNRLKDAPDQTEGSMFGFTAEGSLLILFGDCPTLMIHLSDDRWNALQVLKPRERFAESSDPRFKLLHDDNAMKPIICNVDQRMVGCWAVQGPDHARSLLQIKKNGDCLNQILAPVSEAINGNIIRSDSSLTLVGHGDDEHLNYVFTSPDEMILSDPSDPKLAEIAIRITEDRFASLQKNSSLETSPEFTALETKTKKLKH